jgi:hypothetical protein
MSDTQSTFHRALQTVLAEIFDGPPGEMAFLLNPGDPGLLKQLEAIDATTASNRPMPGRTTIAAHVDHVLYGISLMNRWAKGEPNPWATADWDASWRRGTVDDAAWQDLLRRLRRAAGEWQRAVKDRSEWADVDAAGALSSAAHTAYHLGAIRQILAASRAD